jgi:2-polyprenyl-6-methoxyphenol hydroxylase-like FAD-dependent oxidoreductase
MNDASRKGHGPVEVLVVGAGPTGLTLGCDLARRGVRIRVVERALVPFAGSRGKALQPRTLEIFDDLGVIERVLAEGGEYPSMRIHAGALAFPWDLVKRDRVTAAVPYPNLWMLEQARTEAILRARLEELGGEVETGTELVALEQDDGGVTATLTGGAAEEAVRARYLVGADGGRSRVRKLCGIPFAGDHGERAGAIVGDVHVEGLDRRFWHAWPLAKDGPIALCPLPQTGLFQLFAQTRRSNFADTPTTETVDAFVRQSIGAGSPIIRDATWLSVYRYNVRLAHRYRSGNVLLAGDAAHVHPPTGGQGLNAGVQDAYNLGWKLAAVLAGAPHSLLDTYEEERRAVAADILALATLTYRAKWRLRGEDTKQLRTRYRDSSIAWEARADPGRVRAGDRAPDARGLDAAGRVRRVFEAFRGPHATLLAFGSEAARTATTACHDFGTKVVAVTKSIEPGALVDEGGAVQRTYDTDDGSLVLVRPDGYVGFAGDVRDTARLADYLARTHARRGSMVLHDNDRSARRAPRRSV